MFNWFKKKPAPVKPKLKPQRVAVHYHDGLSWAGTTVVHYAAYRTFRKDGGLSLHDNEDGSGVVADYAPGAWLSISSGTRKVSK
jgi:hypothetical protein